MLIVYKKILTVKFQHLEKFCWVISLFFLKPMKNITKILEKNQCQYTIPFDKEASTWYQYCIQYTIQAKWEDFP